MRRRAISALAAALTVALVLAIPASAWEYASGNGYIIRERVEEDGAMSGTCLPMAGTGCLQTGCPVSR